MAFRRNDWTPQVARQWRPKPGDVAGNPSVIPRQCCQAICNVVMIGAVKLVRRGTMWAVAPQRPQYRARDEQQSQCAAPASTLRESLVILGRSARRRRVCPRSSDDGADPDT